MNNEIVVPVTAWQAEVVQRNRVKITGLMQGGVTPVPVARRVSVPQNGSLGVTARLETADGQLIPLTDSFNVPIFQVGGIVEKTVRANFVDGITQLLVNFPKSGEYVVTQEGLNLHLPEESKLDFENLFISVYEE
jgi:hypothetical protein